MSRTAVSATPASAVRLGPIAAAAGADIFVVQSTVSTARYRSRNAGLDLARLCKELPIPVVVGNCVSFAAALELMQTGVAGLLIGVGPGAACTSREVLGIGVPQVTATVDCSEARDLYYRETGRYVQIITDGARKLLPESAQLIIEPGVSPTVVQGLTARGQNVSVFRLGTSVNSILISPNGPIGAADTRSRGAVAVGY